MSVNRRIEINLEWPLIALVALFTWRYGGYTTALFVAWTMAVILVLGFAFLTYAISVRADGASVQIGGVRAGSRVSPLPSRRSLLTLGAGALAFVYLSGHGHPWLLLGAVALLLELLPGVPSVWDEYLAEVLRRAAVQAGFAGMVGSAVAALAGAGGLEVVVAGLSLYLLALQLYLYRWRRSAGDAIDS